jgi:hypothetical protein
VSREPLYGAKEEIELRLVQRVDVTQDRDEDTQKIFRREKPGETKEEKKCTNMLETVAICHVRE